MIKPGDKIVCGRQDEATMAVQREHIPVAEKRHGFLCCSYCGSLIQHEFLRLAEEGCQLGPTDKSYKVYVDAPHPTPKKLRIVGTSNCKQKESPWRKVTWWHMLRWNRRGSLTLRRGEYILLGEEGPTAHMKFYFQHLDEAGKHKFIELYNGKKLAVGYPGHFYVPPFFCSRGKP